MTANTDTFSAFVPRRAYKLRALSDDTDSESAAWERWYADLRRAEEAARSFEISGDLPHDATLERLAAWTKAVRTDRLNDLSSTAVHNTLGFTVGRSHKARVGETSRTARRLRAMAALLIPREIARLRVLEREARNLRNALKTLR